MLYKQTFNIVPKGPEAALDDGVIQIQIYLLVSGVNSGAKTRQKISDA